MVEKELNSAKVSEYGTENISSFAGGVVVIINETSVICPQCCGSISDYKNWVELLEKSPSNWESIWIGHPWIYGRVRNNTLELSDYVALESSLDTNLSVKSIITLADFYLHLNRSIEELMELKNRIRAVIKVEINATEQEIAELLVENEYKR